MLEVWATLKVWFGFIIPAIIIVVIILVIFCSCFIKSILWNRKIKWLQANGFERYLVGVPDGGTRELVRELMNVTLSIRNSLYL